MSAISFSNAAIIYTFTIGILYVLAQFIIFCIYAALKKRELIKNFLVSNLVLIVLALPFTFYMIGHFANTTALHGFL